MSAEKNISHLKLVFINELLKQSMQHYTFCHNVYNIQYMDYTKAGYGHIIIKVYFVLSQSSSPAFVLLK